MRNDVLNAPPQPSMTALVSGILTDIEQLIVEQTALLRHELREDMRKARAGAIFLGGGLGVTLVGSLLFCLMPPYLLHWAVPELPLWACFGIVGAVFLLLGGGAVYAALKNFQAAAALPESVAALKENVRCLLKPKQSSSKWSRREPR
jgi:Putative Actinobacterial Holin-X, holin superfamily III